MNNILENIAVIIKREYPKKFKTKLEFAAAADVEETTIRRVLKGEQNLSIKLLQQICNAIDIKLSDLFKEIGY
ncbi:MAG: helix-turn-helix transcriptional regulator [Flavobacteriales bacterium]|nr:helix-turn-helix transcriptional regulator [Flavobacteriales bacterium]MBX2959681.1 helix-turn-helix transcriptional regulator [Flavobacteriales bacterium]HRN42767.1 helix-turn-helix transcriptional regulator [Vicingus sp.]HRP60704.1 helix-turn-helix transcriptional regulator [Vicingus sp.]